MRTDAMRAWHAAVLAVLVALAMACHRRTDATEVTNLDGAPVDPYASTAIATVLVFVSTECPISNRYAPELRRLHERFAPRGIEFHLVYPFASESAPVIRAHVKEYGFPFGALRDPKHVLVARVGARVTPEVAVFQRGGKLVYRGRIDDRQVDFGVARPEPTKRDLEDALEAVLAGRPVETPTTVSIGCTIPH